MPALTLDNAQKVLFDARGVVIEDDKNGCAASRPSAQSRTAKPASSCASGRWPSSPRRPRCSDADAAGNRAEIRIDWFQVINDLGRRGFRRN